MMAQLRETLNKGKIMDPSPGGATGSSLEGRQVAAAPIIRETDFAP